MPDRKKVGFDANVIKEISKQHDDDEFLLKIFGVTDDEYDRSVESFLEEGDRDNKDVGGREVEK